MAASIRFSVSSIKSASSSLENSSIHSTSSFSRLMMKMPELIQEETKLLQLAELMASSPQIKLKNDRDVSKLNEASAA